MAGWWSSSKNKIKKNRSGSSNYGGNDVEKYSEKIAKQVDENNPVLPWVFGAAGIVLKSMGKRAIRSVKTMADAGWGHERNE